MAMIRILLPGSREETLGINRGLLSSALLLSIILGNCTIRRGSARSMPLLGASILKLAKRRPLGYLGPMALAKLHSYP